MWVFVTLLALVSARTQPGSSPRYHPEILRQSWTSLCEPIFDNELTWWVSRDAALRSSLIKPASHLSVMSPVRPALRRRAAEGNHFDRRRRL